MKLALKSVLTIIASVLAGSAGVPALAPYSGVLSPIGGAVLGWLHVARPGDVKGPVAP